jgi:hypothetical protein
MVRSSVRRVCLSAGAYTWVRRVARTPPKRQCRSNAFYKRNVPECAAMLVVAALGV